MRRGHCMIHAEKRAVYCLHMRLVFPNCSSIDQAGAFACSPSPSPCSSSVWITARASRCSSVGRTSWDIGHEICLMGAGLGPAWVLARLHARGGGALVVFAGAGTAAGGSETGAAPNEMTPSSSETSFGGAVFQLKYSAADRAGSADSARRKY